MIDHLPTIQVQEWIEAPTVVEWMGWVGGVVHEIKLCRDSLVKAAEFYNVFLIGLQEYHVDIKTPAVHKLLLILSFHVRIPKET